MDEAPESWRTKRVLLIVTGRSRRLAVEIHTSELKSLMADNRHVRTEVVKTIGDVATAFVSASCGAGVIVVQAADVAVY